MEGSVYEAFQRVSKAVGIWVHTCSSRGWRYGVLERSGPVGLVLHKGTQKSRGVGTPSGHTLSLGRGALGRPCSQTLPLCLHSNGSLSWRWRGPQTFPSPVLQGLLGEAVGGSAGPWPLGPQTPGFHGFYGQRQVPVPDCALQHGLGLSREAPHPH